MPLGTGFFLWLRDNKYAQYLTLGTVLAIIIWILDKLRIRRIRKEAVRKANDRAEKQSDKILDKMEKESDDRIEAAREARERVPDGVTADQLRDDARAVLFGRGRNGGGGR